MSDETNNPLASKVAQAYLAIGSLAATLGVFGNAETQRMLDYFSQDEFDDDFDVNFTIDCQKGDPAFEIGDHVLKHTGDYQIKGEVRGIIIKKNGEFRYVVEHTAEGGGSFLHIYSATNLRKVQYG